MKKSSLFYLLIGTGLLISSGCQSTSDVLIKRELTNQVKSELFIEASSDITLENANRRKWDNAVIADLDKDGYLDLLLTDHGYSIKLYWNNKGQYGKGTDILMGDAHGITVGDYDKDGQLDILIARGGGSGANARNAKLFHVSKTRKIIEGSEFNVPLKQMRGRTAKFVDGNNNGDLDLMLLGFPANSKEKKEDPSFIYKNNGKGDLQVAGALPKTFRDGQKMLITDFNSDGILDFLLYGEGRLKAHQGNGDLTFKEVTDELFIEDINHVTNVAEIDADNDGDFDLYITRGEALKAGETYFDEDKSGFYFYTKRGKFKFNDLVIGDVFSLKNYQSGWPEQDIYIGESAYKYKHPGEYHSGQDILLVSSNALGWPDKLEQKGLYIGYIGNDTWRIAGNTWSPTSGVIQGVKSYPKYKHSSGLTDILLENIKGKFVDITQQSKLIIAEHTEAVTVGDFDNNGFQDLIVVKRGDPSKENKQRLFLNQGDGEFKQIENHKIVSPELGATGLGAESYDYNLDGKLDLIYANERGKWHLYKNNITLNTSNHYALFNIGSSPKDNASAIGALVSVKACNQLHVSRVGSSGALYSQSFNNIIHVGLGHCDLIESVSVKWSNAEEIIEENIKVNSIMKLGK
jgi:hypothetical protein